MRTNNQFCLRPCKLSHRPSDDVDYITNLPENVLTIILSRLPTKDAIRTSILSKDWVYKWTSVGNIHINNADCTMQRGPKELFVNFMDRILSLSPFLTSFTLACLANQAKRDVKRWISKALRHSLECLEVNCRIKGLVLPCTLLNRTSLRKLKLCFNFSILNVAANNCAPNLTSLDLFDIKIVNNNTSSVTLSFPLLETFSARRCAWLNVKSVELYAPSLTTFYSHGYNLEKDYDYTFEIHAPRLAKFYGGGSIPEKFDVIYGSSIVSAGFYSDYDFDNLELRKNIGSRVGKMFNKFMNLLELEISTPEVISPPGTPLRPHVKLRELEVESSSNAEQLLALLRASPSVKLLRINVCEWIDYDYEGITRVPSCFVTHLEEIKFRGFLCETRHYNIAKFLLEKGEKLKKITFSALPNSPEKQSEVKDYISAFRIVDIEFVDMPDA